MSDRQFVQWRLYGIAPRRLWLVSLSNGEDNELLDRYDNGRLHAEFKTATKTGAGWLVACGVDGAIIPCLDLANGACVCADERYERRNGWVISVRVDYGGQGG